MTCRLGLAAALAVVLASVAAGRDVPPLTGRVVDLADLLSPGAEQTLTQMLAAHEDSTTNQVVVLTIPSLDGEVLEEYATRVFRTWALGQADLDNGVLLLIALDDREVRIEVGYGLEGSLTDASAGSIIRNVIVPQFKDGNYEAGILSGVTSILGVVEGTLGVPKPEPDGSAWGALLFLLFPLLWTLASFSSGPVVRYAVATPMAALAGVIVGGIALGLGLTEPAALRWGLGTAGSFLLLYIAADLVVSKTGRGMAGAPPEGPGCVQGGTEERLEERRRRRTPVHRPDRVVVERRWVQRRRRLVRRRRRLGELVAARAPRSGATSRRRP